MIFEKIEVDSEVFGGDVVSIRNVSTQALSQDLEALLHEKYAPIYAYTRVPSNDLEVVHALEKLGFKVIECQIQLNKKVVKAYDTSAYGYYFVKVDSDQGLSDAIEISRNSFIDDRIRNDPGLANCEMLARRRYAAYIEKSFFEPNEALFLLINKQTKEPVAFKTHVILNKTEALCLLGGVKNGYNGLGVGPINAHMEHNYFLNSGIKRFTTNISARNHPIMNLEIRGLGFKVVNTFYVLRKLY